MAALSNRVEEQLLSAVDDEEIKVERLVVEARANFQVRPSQADSGEHAGYIPNVRCATSLHASSAAGDLESVRALLAKGCDPQKKQRGGRMLTPLHVAATPAVAEALLAAGARPSSQDPREPEPAWYQRQQGRHDVAQIIAKAARAYRAAASVPEPPRGFFQPGARSAPSAPRQIFPSMSAAETAAVGRSWGVSGAEVRQKIRAAAAASVQNCQGKRKVSKEDLQNLDFECAICMMEMESSDRCIILPCHEHSPSSSTSSCGSSLCARPHAFHEGCLQQWWTKSCRCPTCRCDVRQWLEGRREERRRRATVAA